jgi:hypothetical protein
MTKKGPLTATEKAAIIAAYDEGRDDEAAQVAKEIGRSYRIVRHYFMLRRGYAKAPGAKPGVKRVNRPRKRVTPKADRRFRDLNNLFPLPASPEKKPYGTLRQTRLYRSEFTPT